MGKGGEVYMYNIHVGDNHIEQENMGVHVYVCVHGYTCTWDMCVCVYVCMGVWVYGCMKLVVYIHM